MQTKMQQRQAVMRLTVPLRTRLTMRLTTRLRARRASRRAVSTIRGFSLISLRDLLVASGPTIVLVAVACFVAYLVVDPAPPRSLRLATGQENSAYETFGKQYAAVLARDEIKVTLAPTLGSRDNLQRLLAVQGTQ